jgi:hypothetical protein
VSSNIVFAVIEQGTVSIDILDSSVTLLRGGPVGNNSTCGDAMALNTDGTALYVGYYTSHCVVAYDLSTNQQIWTSDMPRNVNSVSYHEGVVLVGVSWSDFHVLDATDGFVLRKLFKASNWVYGHAVIAGTVEAFYVNFLDLIGFYLLICHLHFLDSPFTVFVARQLQQSQN